MQLHTASTATNVDVVCMEGFWTFLWFVCFCYLADTWRRTEYDNPELGESGVEAAIVFSFFSIGTFVRIRWHRNF